MSKERSNTNWYEKNAKLLDMDLDDEIKKETFIDSDVARVKKQQLNSLKMQLNIEIKKMIFPKYFSKNYLQVEGIEKVNSMNSKCFLSEKIFILIFTSFFFKNQMNRLWIHLKIKIKIKKINDFIKAKFFIYSLWFPPSFLMHHHAEESNYTK